MKTYIVVESYEDAFEHIECSLDEEYPDGSPVYQLATDNDPESILIAQENDHDNTY